MQFIRPYSLKVIFAFTLLLGLQLPNFLQQYEHRLDAHYLEVKSQLQQYQRLADLFFSGDLSALINKHKNSSILLFQEEALIIENLANRFDLLQEKKQALQGALPLRLFFLAGEITSPLFLETQNNYNAEVLLNYDSIITGLICALISTLLFECFFLFVVKQTKYLFHSFSLKSH